jgi:hypothetical protein
VAADERRKTQMGKLDRVIARDPVIGVIGRAKTYRGDAENSKHILIMIGQSIVSTSGRAAEPVPRASQTLCFDLRQVRCSALGMACRSVGGVKAHPCVRDQSVWICSKGAKS